MQGLRNIRTIRDELGRLLRSSELHTRGIPGFGPTTSRYPSAGVVLWQYDTVRDFRTVNGVKAKSGAIDGSGAMLIKGMVFLNSGCSRFGGLPGNVLRAFAPEE